MKKIIEIEGSLYASLFDYLTFKGMGEERATATVIIFLDELEKQTEHETKYKEN